MIAGNDPLSVVLNTFYEVLHEKCLSQGHSYVCLVYMSETHLIQSNQ